MDRGDMKSPEKSCPKLAVRLDKKHIFSKPLDTVDIEDYSFSVGHIIINYLFTDTYQCLKPEGETEDERNCSELATAFEAHAAAVDLELDWLEFLSLSEMIRLEEKLSLVLIARTLNGTQLPLDRYPTITENFESCVSRLSAPASQERKDEMMDKLTNPENVAMVLVKCLLQSKDIAFIQDHDNEADWEDEKVSDTSQLAQEELKILTRLESFYEENSQVYQSTFEIGVREEMARKTLAKTILKTWEASGIRLSSLQHARPQEVQNGSKKLSQDLDTCKMDLEASKKRSQQLVAEGKVIVETLTLEHEIQCILERQKRQNGLLSLSDQYRLRSAQSRSRDLTTTLLVDPLVHSNSKDPKLMNPDQEEEDQPDDDGTQTPTCTSCNRRDRQSSDVKGEKDMLEEVRARLYDLVSETTSTSGQNTPSSTSSLESEFHASYSRWDWKVNGLASKKFNT
ncbi:hypothetical protein F52700_11392 [Fusarium sp. NRRL 52700]|nr:hypothetical protein F52700_11392 [Fusarium sp. NRRL 52700]